MEAALKAHNSRSIGASIDIKGNLQHELCSKFQREKIKMVLVTYAFTAIYVGWLLTLEFLTKISVGFVFDFLDCKGDAAVMEAALKAHNSRRELLASGNVTTDKGNMPSGADIYKLNYKCYVENEARKGVQNCKEGESNRFLGEENSLWVPIFGVRTPAEAVEYAANHWWSRVASADPTDLRITSGWLTPPLRSFTLMGYGYNDQIGCAVKECGEFYFVKCRYKPE
ncbi:unnamed protein product [Strongylus vulgaris]|uniref:SCP domain-containing protein n=1 Tax=Strongylus vulgaris TaxID=40348 RepID=A0A3P7JJW4_STRVU|nr:unnamed protein product [Strongylus vulgaris]